MHTDNAEFEIITAHIRSYYAGRPDVAAVYVFGSAAGSNFTPESDIDIGVLYKYGQELDPMARLSEQQELGDLLNRPVDLVKLNDASPILCYQVLKKGQRILCCDRRAADAFFVRTLNEYFDLKRNREVIEKSLQKVRIV